MFKYAEIDDWQQIYDEAPTASFFQSPQWSQIWSRYTGGRYRPAPVRAYLPSGKTVLIPLTRQQVMGGINSVWHAAPAGTYGGWLMPSRGGSLSSSASLTQEEIRLMLIELFRFCRSLVYRWYPFSETLSEVDDTGQTESSLTGIMQPDRTFIIDCSVGEQAVHDLLYGGDGKMRRKITKARNSGIRIRKSGDVSDWLDYHALYVRGSRRWSDQPQHIYDHSFFEILAGHREHCELWLAEKEGNILAGAVLMYGKDHVVYWHGAFDQAHRALRPVNLLLATLIEMTCKRGYRWFDFNPSMGLAGVEHFKSSFGAKPFAAPVLKQTSGFLLLSQSIKRRITTITDWKSH